MKNKHLLLASLLMLNLQAFAQSNPNDLFFDGNTLFSTVQKYVSLGEHRTGTSADVATSEWIWKELNSVGYDVKYLEFPIRQFFPEKVFVSAGTDTIQAFPLWWINENIERVISGRFTDANKATSFSANDIALIRISAQAKTNPKKYIDSLTTLGVKGIVAITEGPSSEIVSYNTSEGQQPWKVPIILIAPKDSARALEFIKKAKPVTLAINGTFKDVQCRNVYGTIGRGEKYIVVSTPISGWFTCGGERGSGLAVWLALAKWAASEKLDYTFVFTANSGHEHAFKGAHEFLIRNAPPVDKTRLWIHLGAGAATLEWKKTESGLVKQINVDPNRQFFYSAEVEPAFSSAFKNIGAQKILSTTNPGGELMYVARKGYTRFAGVSYGHPFFHVKTDDANTTSPKILEETAKAFRDLILNETK